MQENSNIERRMSTNNQIQIIKEKDLFTKGKVDVYKREYFNVSNRQLKVTNLCGFSQWVAKKKKKDWFTVIP